MRVEVNFGIRGLCSQNFLSLPVLYTSFESHNIHIEEYLYKHASLVELILIHSYLSIAQHRTHDFADGERFKPTILLSILWFSRSTLSTTNKYGNRSFRSVKEYNHFRIFFSRNMKMTFLNSVKWNVVRKKEKNNFKKIKWSTSQDFYFLLTYHRLFERILE